jgi:hypothetical protein
MFSPRPMPHEILIGSFRIEVLKPDERPEDDWQKLTLKGRASVDTLDALRRAAFPGKGYKPPWFSMQIERNAYTVLVRSMDLQFHPDLPRGIAETETGLFRVTMPQKPRG